MNHKLRYILLYRNLQFFASFYVLVSGRDMKLTTGTYFAICLAFAPVFLRFFQFRHYISVQEKKKRKKVYLQPRRYHQLKNTWVYMMWELERIVYIYEKSERAAKIEALRIGGKK